MGRSNRDTRAKHSQKWIVTTVLVFSSTLSSRASELSKVEANHVVQVILVSAKTYKNPFGETSKGNRNSTLNMHLLPKGEFAVGKDKWGEVVRVNMLKIRDWSKVPGVKKAWTMKGFEGEDYMAFHPVISEVKGVDVPLLVRCRLSPSFFIQPVLKIGIPLRIKDFFPQYHLPRLR